MSHVAFLTLRSLKARPSRTLLTTLGVVLGVAVILAIRITNLSTLDSITSLFNEASGKAHLAVTSSVAEGQGFAEDAVHRVSSVPGVKAAVPVLHVQTLLADEAPPEQMSISFFGAVGGGLMLYGVDPSLDSQAREYKIVSGEFLGPNLGAYDLVLVKDYAEEKDIDVGDDIAISTPAAVEVVRVVGLMSKEGPGRLNNGAFGVLPLQAAQEMFARLGDLDQIDVVATAEAASAAGLDELKAVLQDRLGDDYAVIYPATQGRRVTQMLDGYQLGLNFVSVIALFVGGFLILNALWMTVVERTREIGVLRTVGMTRYQAIVQILAEAGALGMIGSLLGVGFGILLSRGLIRVMDFLVAQDLTQTRVPFSGLLTSLLTGVGVTLIAAAIPAWQAGRITPLEAVRIRGNPRQSGIVRHGWLLGVALLVLSYVVLYVVPLPRDITWVGHAFIIVVLVGSTLIVPVTVAAWESAARPWIRRLYGSEGQLGSQNTRRATLRTSLTVAALLVGVAMILSIWAVVNAFAYDIGSWIEKYIGGDLYVHSSLPMRVDLGRRLAAVEGVAAVAPTRYFDVKWLKPDAEDEVLTFTGIEPLAYEQVASFLFATGQGDPDLLVDRLIAGDAVFVSSVLAEKYGLKQGDTVRLETRREVREFEVAAVVVDFYNRGLVMQGSWNDMRRYFGLNDVSAFLIRVEPGHSADEVEDSIERLYGQRRHLAAESNSVLKARALTLMAQMSSMFDVLALIALIVAALGVINTLSMNVLERTQEIGMLRSVGMTRWQVRKMILAEAGMMGIIGGVVGLALGLFLSHAVLRTINVMMGYELTYVLPVQGIAVSLFIALIVSQLAAIWPARRAARIRIIEAIQFE